MKTRTIATLTALSLSVFAGLSARAESAAVTVAQPVDGIEVIVVRAKRPDTLITDEAPVAEAAPIAAAPASEATDEIEVILVTATRADQLAAIRELAREAMAARAAMTPRTGGWNQPLWNQGRTWKTWAGMPVR
jgi:hypothetical protein